MGKKPAALHTPFVVTAASDIELPVAWLQKPHIAVVSGRGLGSGILRSPLMRDRNPEDLALLVVTTGAGPERAREAVSALLKECRPRAVLNIGAAGGLDPTLALGTWVLPSAFESPDGNGRICASDWSCSRPSFPIVQCGTLLTVSRAHLGNISAAWRRYSCVDMEAFGQAELCAMAKVPFAAIKMLTDDSGRDAPAMYRARLAEVRNGVREVLSSCLP